MSTEGVGRRVQRCWHPVIAGVCPCAARGSDFPAFHLHIPQRGVDRTAVFLDEEDCASYLQVLELAAGDKGVAIYAYVLMTSHVHLLVGAEAPGAVSG